MKTITAKELEEKLSKGETLNLIDVREPEETAEGMIPWAKNIPMMEIPGRLNELDRDQEYIIICRSGNRSTQVCMFLEEQGYKVTNLENGMQGWTGKLEQMIKSDNLKEL